MDSFIVRTTLIQQDWQALMIAAGARAASLKGQKGSLLTRTGPTLSWILLVAVLMFMLASDPPLISPVGMGLVAALFIGFWWFQYYLQQRTYAPSESGTFLGEARFEFEARGFHEQRANSGGFNQWSFVKEITCTEEHVFLWIDVFSAYVIPARDLPAPMNAQEAVKRMREFMASSAVVNESTAVNETAVLEPLALSDAAAPALCAPAAPPPLPSVAQELQALLRLHVWKLVDGARLFGRDVTILLLGVLSFVLWAGLDRLNYEGEAVLFWYTISEIGMLVLAVLAVGWLMSRISRPRVELRRSLLLVLGFLPIFIVGIWLAMRFSRVGAMATTLLLTIAADFYLVRGMRSLTGKRQQFAVSSVLIATLLMFYLAIRTYFSPGIWFEPEADTEQAAAMRRDNEQLVFEQSTRLTAAIDAMPPRVEARSNAFFVGFAGYGAQRVFAEEISLASKRVGERYDVGGRSLLLVNDRRDNETHPIATVPALRHALMALGKRMNVDEDVLFLSLSSHGSEDATISVSSEIGYWRDLSADELADMLRDSGIRWKVIVLSACHAGSFIDALRDEKTIILTAAAADKTSFGCSDDRDLTYFGEAFYRDALPGAANLREAFDVTRREIEKRESSEMLKKSDPQAHFGAELEKKLSTIEAARAPAFSQSLAD